MRVLLDTNVLVSAFATRGLCADVFRLAAAEHEVICAEVVLDKLQRVLTERFHLPAGTVSDITALLRSFEFVPKPRGLPKIKVRDEDDAWVLASALTGRADILVTGDRDLLVLGDVAAMRILDPRGFWSLVKTA
ncbi:MAG: putative toxin-antitoxin system toxin component, PIN family [Bacillota bacterium]